MIYACGAHFNSERRNEIILGILDDVHTHNYIMFIFVPNWLIMSNFKLISVAMLSALVLAFIFVTVSASVAPGDEEALCERLRASGAAPTPAYSSNMRVLMDSWNYQNLLPSRTGAVWDQVDNDMNNPSGVATNVSCVCEINYT